MATILITGAARGIGRTLARLYAEDGHEVLAAVRDPERFTPPAPNIAALPLDVADAGSVAALAQRVGDRPIDVLINNAGIMGPERQSAADMDYEGFLGTLAVNTLGPLRVTQALLPQLRRAGGARVIILSSIMGSLGDRVPGHVAYRTSKTAVNKVMQMLAVELAPEGISVASIHPGWVRTDMGGPNAHLDVEESARGVRAVIDGLDVSRTGRFWNYDGGNIAW